MKHFDVEFIPPHIKKIRATRKITKEGTSVVVFKFDHYRLCKPGFVH